LDAVNAQQAQNVQTLIADWVNRSGDLRALALCGSWARGEARPDSDIDLLVLAHDPSEPFQAHMLASIPFDQAGFVQEAVRWVRYGAVRSAHVSLCSAVQLELSFADVAWAKISPVDPGTRNVIGNGFAVLIDKDGLLAKLIAATGAGA
jgi:uncharacterized protein